MINYLNEYTKSLLSYIAIKYKFAFVALTQSEINKPFLFKAIAWVIIVFQFLFPLSIVFTPAIAAVTQRQTIIATEPYVIGPGENLNAIAQKYHISRDELKKLNQFRKFSKPFEQLTLGDEIDIPLQVTDFSADPATRKATSVSPDKAAISQDYSTRQRNVFDGFSSANNTVGSRAPRDSGSSEAGSMVRSTAAGEAGQSVQQWLSQFGTARVQLNVNDDLNLDGSALDLLVPLYEQPHEMFFTQLGARNKDSRNTFNIGGGSRTWLGDWMFGMNAFFDYDLTGENRRLGLGLEAWRDYLKFSANNYARLSGWRDSRDLDDYRERPANGFDIRAEAFLPAYPQLGGQLIYEQYRGSNVALFGKDNLQKDPYAITLGVNYTPISLLTLGVNHRQGKGEMNDTTFNLEMNYRLGASLQSQLSPDEVAATRTLAGSRHDLVNRNNDIVLQYQKQQVIELRLPERLSGYESEQAAVVAQITSKYALDRIDWDFSAITAAGGSVSQIGQATLIIRLPPYQRDGNATNLYNLSAVARDVRKNVSNSATTRIEVLPAAAQISKGDLKVTADDALANGIATNAVRATVTDAQGTPVAGQRVVFTANNGATITTVIDTTGADGIATATLTNTRAGISEVTATLNGTGQSVNTTFVADSSTAQITQGNLQVTANNALANGIAANAVRAIITDAQGNPLAGQTVTFTATNGATVTTVIGITGADGVATATLTNTTAGISQVAAALSNGNGRSVDTTFAADTGTKQIASLTVTADDALANGIATNAVRATVTDAQGNPLAGQTVIFTADNGATVTTATGTTDADGIVTTALTKITAGISRVTATLSNGDNRSVDTTFIADTRTKQIASLTVTGDGALADGTATNTVRATVTDAQGNPLAGQAVTFTAGNGATVITATVTTDADGIATATLTNTTAGISQVTAALTNGNNRSVDTTFIADTGTKQIASLTVTADGALANGSAANAVRATVTDAQGNLLAGQTVTFTAGNGAAITTVIGTTGADGIATATLTNTTAGISQVTATLSNSSRSVDTTFIADTGTKQIASLTVIANDALANGSATNVVRATVTDVQGNPLAGQTVNFTAGNGATVISATVTTDADGIATTTLTNTTAGISQVTAALSDGGSRSVDTTFTADTGTKQIASLTVTDDNALANGIAANAVRATVTDGQGNLLAGQTVTFTATNGAVITAVIGTTGADGIATATLTNTRAGISQVTATLNETGRTVNTTFVADNSTAQIAEGNLTVTADNALANGIAANAVRATVTDTQGNPLAGQVVVFTVDNGAAITTIIGTTGADGVATATLTNTRAGISRVTATLTNDNSRSVNTTFIADTGTKQIASLTVTADGALANGIAANAVRATVTDAQGNLLAGQAVTFTAGNGAMITTVIGTTGADGAATATLTNTTAGISRVTAALSDGGDKSVETTFVADTSTAQIADGNLIVTANNAPADGNAANAVRAMVTDAHGNPLAGQTVTFTAGNGATVITATVTTDADGIATTTLTNTTAGVSAVTATLNNSNSRMVETTFIADAGTRQVASLTVTADGALANGSDTNAVRATVTDAQGNPLAGQTVTFTAGNGATVTAVIGITGADGIATAILTNTTAGISQVTAALSNGNGRSVDTTFTADSETGRFVELRVTSNEAPADGTTTNAVVAKVVDANNNPLINQTITFRATNGATMVNVTAVTNSEGEATATLTSRVEGVSLVTAQLENGITETTTVNFTQNIFIRSITVVDDRGLANGEESNTADILVVNAAGQPLPGIELTISGSVAPNRGNFRFISPTIAVTDSNGIVRAEYTNNYTSTVTLTARLPNGTGLNGTGGTFNLPNVTMFRLVGTVPADGVTRASVRFQLISPRGAVVANSNVSVSTMRYEANGVPVQTPARTVSPSVTTDGNGEATVEVVSNQPDRLVYVILQLISFNAGGQGLATQSYFNGTDLTFQ